MRKLVGNTSVEIERNIHLRFLYRLPDIPSALDAVDAADDDPAKDVYFDVYSLLVWNDNCVPVLPFGKAYHGIDFWLADVFFGEHELVRSVVTGNNVIIPDVYGACTEFVEDEEYVIADPPCTDQMNLIRPIVEGTQGLAPYFGGERDETRTAQLGKTLLPLGRFLALCC